MKISIVRTNLDRWNYPLLFTRGLLRNSHNIYLSLIQPFVLIVVLTLSLSIHFPGSQDLAIGPVISWSTNLLGSQELGMFYQQVQAAEYFTVTVLLITLLLASQYGNQIAQQLLRFSMPFGNTYKSGNRKPSIKLGVRLLLSSYIYILFCLLILAVFTQMFFSIYWPWRVSSFWILILGMSASSIGLGFLLGSLLKNQDWSDVVLTVTVFGIAILGGGLFPYDLTSPLWSLTRYNPFSILHSRLVYLFLYSRGTLDGWSGVHSWIEGSSGATLSGLEIAIIIVTFCIGFVTLVRIKNHNSQKSALSINLGVPFLFGKLKVQKGTILGTLGMVVLPLIVLLIAPRSVQITDQFSFTWFSWGPTVPFFHSVFGPATLLLGLMNGYGVSLVTQSPQYWQRYTRFSHTCWVESFRFGLGAILGFMIVVRILFPFSIGQLVYGFLLLLLFHGWSLALFYILSRKAAHEEAYRTAVVGTIMGLTFLGGSFWDPARLRWGSIDLSYLFPQGLLIHRSSYTSVLVVLLQILVLVLIAQRQGRRQSPGKKSLPLQQEMVSRKRYEGVHHQTLISLRLSERKRILDEIHDTLGHGITGALWQIRSAQGMEGSDELKATLARAAGGLEESLVKIRRFLRDGQPRISQDWSQFMSTLEAFQACPIHFALEGDLESFHSQAIHVFVQVLQELLTNALRYGNPTTIGLQLIHTDRYSRIEYSEQGNGWGPQGPRLGFGLSKLSQLFLSLGGSFHLAELSHHQGIRVIGVIPHEFFSGDLLPTIANPKEEG